ncbi:MAG: nucleoside 2-deoxyribosyltransferase [Oscillospiraceae bacterium]|nr:nucleoside 2-deoxyribosyltransferase [Oscillospiraceae bacterium]
MVLTEHVGDLSLSAFEQDTDADAAIYLQDTAWIRECDLLIGECTRPSLGVGYELAYAEKLGKPCYIFYRKSECELSAMIKGDSYYKVFPYEDPEEMLKLIDYILR